MHRIASLAASALVATLPSSVLAADASNEAVDAVRKATERYIDVNVALADGYVREPMNKCVTAEMEGQPRQLGVMGVHYVRPDLLGLQKRKGRVTGTGTHTDFTKPGVLVYEPQADGSARLVAVENLVFERAWREAGNGTPPEFLGHQYYLMIDNPLTTVDEAHGFEPHYELHAWVFRNNPNGLFAPFNVAATCEHHEGSQAHAQ